MDIQRIKNFLLPILLLTTALHLNCSYPRIVHNQNRVLIEGIDIDQTLIVVDATLKQEKIFSVLSLWAVRDQIITPKQADKISIIYFNNIDNIKKSFEVWHFTWAISNLYRNGNDEVKIALELAYQDAKKRAKSLDKKKADEKVNGDKIYMGFSHIMGYFYAKTHLVVPGNRKFLESANKKRYVRKMDK